MNEEEWHESLKKLNFTDSGLNVQVPIGDDGCVVSMSSENLCIVKDLCVENVHFNLKWSNLYQVFRKCLVSNLSDLFAMGARPQAWLLGLVIPPKLTHKMPEISEILRQISKEFSVELIGGDTTKGSELTISITALGTVVNKPFLRSNAEVGDLVYLSGYPGLSKFYLDKLQKNEKVSQDNYHLRPSINLELSEMILTLNGRITAMDLSDSLSTSLKEISKQSKVGINIFENKLKILSDFSELSFESALKLILQSGEEYFSLLCIPRNYPLPQYLKESKLFYQIGEVVEGKLVQIVQENGNIYTLKNNGYSHF